MAGLACTLAFRRLAVGRKAPHAGALYDSSYPPSDPKFEVLSRINGCQVTEHGELQYSRRYRVRAMQDHLVSYADCFSWSGKTRT
ncbi:hypothetical protein [Dactylosporangium sp. NPDC051541]|uniref:hypothetical protein n=1 Tax=Dactylosporangium sp. NPDC051541 TaxID=3363977 RepID=UPI0037ABDAD2